METKKEPGTYNRNFAEAVKNAFNGIFYTIKSQSNMKRQLLIAAIVIGLSLFFNLSKIECLFLTLAIFLVLLVEMINTAIETTVNLVTNKFHPKAKLAKDIGAGAVIIASLNAVVVAYFIFFDKIVLIIKNI